MGFPQPWMTWGENAGVLEGYEAVSGAPTLAHCTPLPAPWL